MSRRGVRKPRELERSEALPIDVLPCSNGEFVPGPPTAGQLAIMRLADQETDRLRRRFHMSRRDFVRSSAAFVVGLWAIDQVAQGVWGQYASAYGTRTNKACDLEWPGAQLANLPGEFIFDIQSHHVESDDAWRVNNPAFEAFFAAVWAQAGGVAPAASPDRYWPGSTPLRGGREIDPIENLSRYHYLKELFLDSSTTMTVLSAVPAAPDQQPLPTDRAALTCDTVTHLAGGTQRTIMHAFVMPNRGAYGMAAGALRRDPLFMGQEFELMERNIETWGGHLRGWKIYTAWGDVPNASGWFLDDAIGAKFLAEVRRLGDRHGIPKLVAVHKGFALPGFDQRAASPRDIGPAARRFPDVTIVVYHSGYNSERVGPYPGDGNVKSAGLSVDSLVKSLRENGWDAGRFVPAGLEHGNVPNVYAEIGSTWRSVMHDPDQAAHLLGKLITHVGPQRVCWGTDSLWFGSPQSEIVAFRAFQLSERAKELYRLPYGLDGDASDPRVNALDAAGYLRPHPHVDGWPVDGRSHPERTIRNAIFGRNAAPLYRVDPGAARRKLSCDDVQKIRDAYYLDQMTPRNRAPLAANQLHGPRTRRELLKLIPSGPLFT
jgi:uncharacterized protein